MKESRRPLAPGRRSNFEVSFFRFSFCSQVELESMNVANLNPSSATVLMVNLDNGLTDSRSRELKWKRIESLERSISPVAHTLIRFSYGEILYATRNFSKGIESGLFCFFELFSFLLMGLLLLIVIDFVVVGRQGFGQRSIELCFQRESWVFEGHCSD